MRSMRYPVTAILLLIVALSHAQLNSKSSISGIGEFLIDTNTVYITAAGSQSNPTVGFDGTNYLIVWAEDRSDLNLYDIYGARVNGAGNVIDTITIAISTATDWQTSPGIAFDGALSYRLAG